MHKFQTKGAMLSFVIFAIVFGASGLWAAGFFCWLLFVAVIAPDSWLV